MYFIIIGGVVLLDQLVKYLIQANMALNHTIPVILDFFHITYIQNKGAAFSIFAGRTEILILIPTIVTLLLLAYIMRRKRQDHWVLLLSLSLIAAGGIGNLIDRLSYGYVVDFFDFRVFPVFNVADISVCCGCGLLLLYMFFVEPKLAGEKKNHE